MNSRSEMFKFILFQMIATSLVMLHVARASATTSLRGSRNSAAFPIDLSESTDQATTFDVEQLEWGAGNASASQRQTDFGASAASGTPNMAEYLASLPVLSVGQKHAALFECDMSASSGATKLVWVKLVSRANKETSNGEAQQQQQQQQHDGQPADDITPLSLDKRLITPDKRFKVLHRAPHKWVLSIDNVGAADDKAFYLCQAFGGAKQSRAPNNFIGGAQLNVLLPPKLVEEETSANLVSANEYEPLRLICKVVGEPQAQLVWRREDGRPLEGLEQRFKHQLKRSQAHQLISIDSSELLFESVRREQAGAYLCIASNGVQPGVSQRMSVTLVKCRASERLHSELVDCATNSDSAQVAAVTQATSQVSSASTTPLVASTSNSSWPTSSSTEAPARAKWRMSAMSTSSAMSRLNANAAANHSSSAPANKRMGQQAPDKIARTSRLHASASSSHKNDRALTNGAHNNNNNNNYNKADSNGANSPQPSTGNQCMQIALALGAIARQIATLRARMQHEHH